MTKELFDTYQKVKEQFELELHSRCKQVQAICNEYDFNSYINYFEDAYINDNGVCFSESWDCMGESGVEYSRLFPIECLWDDDALKSFIIAEKKEKERMVSERKRREEERTKTREYEEYIRLKKKFEE